MSQYEDVELDPPLVNEISAAVPKEAKYYQQLKSILRNDPNKKQWVIEEVLRQNDDGKLRFSSGVDVEKRRTQIEKLYPFINFATIKKMRPLQISELLKARMTASGWRKFVTDSIDSMESDINNEIQSENMYPHQNAFAGNGSGWVCCGIEC